MFSERGYCSIQCDKGERDGRLVEKLAVVELHIGNCPTVPWMRGIERASSRQDADAQGFAGALRTISSIVRTTSVYSSSALHTRPQRPEQAGALRLCWWRPTAGSPRMCDVDRHRHSDEEGRTRRRGGISRFVGATKWPSHARSVARRASCFRIRILPPGNSRLPASVPSRCFRDVRQSDVRSAC